MTPPGLRIRDCVEADLAALGAALPAGGHAVQLANARGGRRDFLVAELAAAPVGTVVVRWAGVAEGAGDLGGVVPEIGSLAVPAAVRRQGVATALVAAAEQRVRARGFDRAAILVAATSTGARRLYRRLGYTDTGLRRQRGTELVLLRRL